MTSLYCCLCQLPIQAGQSTVTLDDCQHVVHNRCIKCHHRDHQVMNPWFDVHSRVKELWPPLAALTQQLEALTKIDKGVDAYRTPVKEADQIVLVPTFVPVTSKEELP